MSRKQYLHFIKQIERPEKEPKLSGVPFEYNPQRIQSMTKEKFSSLRSKQRWSFKHWAKYQNIDISHLDN